MGGGIKERVGQEKAGVGGGELSKGAKRSRKNCVAGENSRGASGECSQ